MKSTFTKFTALLIALTLSISLMAQTYSGGSGTSGSPYQIADKDDLEYLSENSGEWTKYFIQTANIVFVDADFQSGGAFYNGGEGFIPIGTFANYFSGSYNGDGYTLDGLYINRSTTDYVGFFGMANGSGTLSNINMDNVDITGKSCVGGVAGRMTTGTIEFCNVNSGSVNGNGIAGGLFGYCNSTSSTIQNCSAGATVSVATGDAGGLIGMTVKPPISCFSTGNISGDYKVGGLIGRTYTYGGRVDIVENCYSLGNVTRSSGTETTFGAFIGEVDVEDVDPMMGNPAGDLTVKNCYSTGDVNNYSTTDKGFIGLIAAADPTYEDNFFDSEASNQTTSIGATAKTTTQMQTQSTFTNWDFTGTTCGTDYYWEINSTDNSGYPYLCWQVFSGTTTPTTQATNITFSGIGYNQMDIGWTVGDGSNRVVFVKQTSSDASTPIDGTTYTASTTFGSGTQIGSSGWYCVYNGTETSVTVTGLTQGTGYQVHVCEYNGNAGSELYLTSSATNNPKSQTTTILATPTTQATNITFSSVSSSQIDIDWTVGNGSNRVVFVKQASSGEASPADGTTYTANATFGSGTQIESEGWYCVYNATGTSVTVTGLTQGTAYHVHVCEYSGGAGSELYLTTSSTNNPKSQATTAITTPTTQATNITFSGIGDNQMDMDWTAGNGSNRVVFVKQASSGTASPVDETTYTANATFGSGTQIGSTGWYCVYNGTGTSVTVTGFTISTIYRVHVCEYNGSSSNEIYLSSTVSNNPNNEQTSSEIPFTYTGAHQSWIVPSGVTEISVQVWGAGGGGLSGSYNNNTGGSGGYTQSSMTVTPGHVFCVTIGQGGGYGAVSNTSAGVGGWPGGGHGTYGDAPGGGGGGTTGLFLNNSYLHGDVFVIAGSGGGGGYRAGGAGGGTSGNDGGSPGGSGGTQVSGGTGSSNGDDGSALQGGNGDENGYISSGTADGGGGGSGYYGGEGGFSDANAGGGGSAYINSTYTVSSTLTVGNNGVASSQTYAQAPGRSTNDYGFGASGSSNGGNGYITISYSLPFSYSGGSGTSGDPYQIDNLTDLKYFSENSGEWSKYFIQTADIVFNASDFQNGGDFYNGGEGFIPIGNNTTKFTASYDGGGHTIDGLTINRNSTDYMAMFGRANEATIQNVGVINVDITGSYYSAGLVGYSTNSTISNCYATGSVTGTLCVGGLVGYNLSNSIVEKSYAICSVTGTGEFVGGLIGTNAGAIIRNSYCRGDVIHTRDVEADKVGAFCGYNVDVIQYCYSTGSVTYVGVDDPTDKGFIGVDYVSSTTNFFDKEASNQTTANGATAKTTTQMKLATTFLDDNWDFTLSGNKWAMNTTDNSGYPWLRFENNTPSHIWLGSSSTAWATPGNWSENSAPTSTNNVIVADVSNTLIISNINAECNSVIVEPNETISLENNGNLTVSGSQ